MHATHSSVPLRGKVSGFNLSPKGIPEGILLRLEDGTGTVQINFDPEVAGEVTAVAVVGNALVADAIKTDVHADAAHSVFHLTRISDSNGKSLFVAEGLPESDVAVRGKVIRLNHALRGEVNGGILDTGEFVHLKPQGVKAIGGLSVGQTLEARGEVRSGWSGTRVIEARVANGVEIARPLKDHGSKHKAPCPKHPPHGPKHGPKLKAAAH